MAESPGTPERKVVKRVVRRPVQARPARPGASIPTDDPPAATSETGSPDPVARAASRPRRRLGKSRSAIESPLSQFESASSSTPAKTTREPTVRDQPDTTAGAPAPEQDGSAESSAPVIRLSRPSMPSFAGVWRRSSGSIASVIRRTSGVASGSARSVTRVGGSTWQRTRAWRMPAQPPVRATIVTGVIVGLLAVALGAGSLSLFERVRGVAAGGGFWGTVTLAVIAALAGVVAARLLRLMRLPDPGATAAFGVLAVIVLMLVGFMGPASTVWAWLVVPALAAPSLLVGHYFIQAALERERTLGPDDRRGVDPAPAEDSATDRANRQHTPA